MAMSKVEKEAIKHLLEECECEVEFVKLDGKVRKMICTKVDQEITVQDSIPGICTVWSVKDAGYRSFYYDNIRSVKVVF